MATKRNIEVFSAGCPTCDALVEQIRAAACDSCDVEVVDSHNPKSAARARSLGVRSLPAVAIDGMLADCCSVRGVDVSVLRAAGLGQALA